MNSNSTPKLEKYCNCKKSNCLKLYCECFAAGVFCNSPKCNCVSCFNNSDHEDQRKLAISSTLERNPSAFRSKIVSEDEIISKARHQKGCHCKKSNCLKKYCECFQANISCTNLCRCKDCQNFALPPSPQDSEMTSSLKSSDNIATISSTHSPKIESSIQNPQNQANSLSFLPLLLRGHLESIMKDVMGTAIVATIQSEEQDLKNRENLIQEQIMSSFGTSLINGLETQISDQSRTTTSSKGQPHEILISNMNSSESARSNLSHSEGTESQPYSQCTELLLKSLSLPDLLPMPQRLTETGDTEAEEIDFPHLSQLSQLSQISWGPGTTTFIPDLKHEPSMDQFEEESKHRTDNQQKRARIDK